MNHVYKIIWCSSLQIFKVCSENAKSSKTKSSKTKSARNELIESKSKVITTPKLTTLALLLSATTYALAGDLTPSSTIVADNDSKTEAGLAITTTANYANAGTAKNTGSLTLSNSTINTSGAWSFGLSSGTNSNIEITDLTINTSGERGYGILAESGGKITGNADITVTGQKAHAVQAGSQGTNSSNPYNGSTAGDVILTGGKITVDINKTINNNWATALHAIDQGTITANNIVIASNSRGLLSESNSKISITNSSINTTGSEAALSANNDQLKTDPTIKGGVINVSNTNIITTGVGASAEKGGTIIFNNNPNKDLNAGTLTTQGYGLESKDAVSSIEATNLDIIVTGLGDQTFGVNATNKGSVILNGGSIKTNGQRGYGIIAHNDGYVESNADITVNGVNTHAVQAGGTGTNSTKYDGTTAGKVVLTGGTLKVENANGWAAGLHAVDQGEIDASNIFIESKVAGAHAESNSLIKIKNSNISADKVGLVANNDQKKYDSTAQGGKLIVSNTTVTTSGNNSIGASADFGGYIHLQDSSIVTTGTNAIGVSASNDSLILLENSKISTSGNNASALLILNSGTIAVNKTDLSSADAPTVAIVFDKQNQTANLTFGENTTAITNNGTLLLVSSLNNDGNDGVVNFTLNNGSKSTGDIIDARSGLSLNGGTNVTLEEKATWTGKLVGIKNFVTKQQSTANFTDRFEIGGDLQGNIGSIFNFSKEGAYIGGDLTGNGTIFNFSKEDANAPITTIIGNIVLNNSQTKGGTINTPITVSGNVDINDASSIFGGNWKIDGKLTNSGNLNIGNSIGKVTVGSGLTLEDSSTYNVEVNYQGDSDMITVTNGDIKLGGKVVISTLDNFKLNSPYTIIKYDYNPNITGQFESFALSKPSAFLDVNIAQNTNSVDVEINRNNTTFASVTTSTNQASIANALDQIPAPLNDNRINPYMRVAAFTIEEQTPNVINKILQLSADEAQQAFEELAGNTNASIRTGLVSTANITADVVNNRMRSTFNGVGSKQTAVLHFVPAEKSINTGFWASGFGSWIDQKGNANANGLKTSTGGFLTGVDIGLSSGWNLGITTGYSKTDMDAKGHYASTTSDNWHLGVYGGNQWGPLGLRAGIVYTGSSLDGKRAVNYGNTNEMLTSDYHAHSTQVFADVGYQIDLAPATIEPFVNLSHVNLRTKGYSETGGDAALEVASNTTNTTFSTFGIRTAVPFAIGSVSANLKGTLGWRHAYGDITPVATQSIAGGVFTVDGIAITKNTALLETGLDFQISPVATAGLSYVGQFGSGIRENGFNATFNYKF